MINRFFVPISLLVLLILSYALSLLLTHSAHNSHSSQTDATTPNVFMTNSTYDTYTAEGELTNTVKTTQTTYNHAQDQTNFNDPNIITYADNQQTWHITSLHGNSMHHNSEIKLWDQVVFHRLASEASPATTITTTEAMIYPKQSLAHTEQPVTITHLQSIIHGIGMTAHLKTGDYTLLSQTEGHYIPETSSTPTSPATPPPTTP